MRGRLIAALAALALVVLGIATAATAHGRGPSPGAGPAVASGGMPMAMAPDEFAYLTRMIPHHEEAVAAARVLVAGTSSPEMRAFGQGIVATQTAEIRQMEQWLARWYPGRDVRTGYTPMMRDLSGLTGDALDRAFLTGMIPHHMAAVMMSRRLLTDGAAVHAPVRPFATTIGRTQSAEILRMRTWLAQESGTVGGLCPGRGLR